MKPRAVLVALSVAAVWLVTEVAVAKPPGAPPEHGRNAPPPAWAQLRSGARWLAYSSYCWGSSGVHVCADAAAPVCGNRLTPSLRVARGEIVRFHLGFAPTSVSVTVGNLRSRPHRLQPSKITAWKVTRRGVLLLFARRRGGDASYAACLRLSGRR
jgi:hypothetical protein